MTLEKIRAALPKYIMLTRGKHFVKWGDEFLAPENYEAWRPIVRGNEIGSLYDKHSCWMRRPIPPHILDNQAFWLRFGDSASIRVGTKEEHSECAFLRSDKNGGAAFYLQSTMGRLYDKWLLEQMEGI